MLRSRAVNATEYLRGNDMKGSYVAPELVDYGSITDRTFRITVGHSHATKGGVACAHLDWAGALSGSICAT